MDKHVSADHLLDLQTKDLRVQLFSMREHNHIQDGDGKWHCLPHGARVIVINPYPTSIIDVDKLSFAVCEATARMPVLALPGDSFNRVFDVRGGDAAGPEDDLPF